MMGCGHCRLLFSPLSAARFPPTLLSRDEGVGPFSTVKVQADGPKWVHFRLSNGFILV